mmetsp:Transcript_5019/g.7929  ORF Transcript_5019/g.7929 Transcript_5019/m.7929 type:complete len:91 (+) Transcript_5019:187-459(+)
MRLVRGDLTYIMSHCNCRHRSPMIGKKSCIWAQPQGSCVKNVEQLRCLLLASNKTTQTQCAGRAHRAGTVQNFGILVHMGTVFLAPLTSF